MPVAAVERETITLGAGVASATSPTLTTVTSDTHAIPFITKRVSTLGTVADDVATYCVHCDVDPGPVAQITTDAATAVRELVVELGVVQFDGTSITVQKSQNLAFSGTSLQIAIPSPVTRNNSFLVFTWRSDNDSTDHVPLNVRGQIDPDGLNMTFTRDSALSTPIAIEWAVVTNDGSEFTVEHIDAVIADTATSGTAAPAVTAAELGRSFLLGSFRGHGGAGNGNDNEDATVNATLSENLLTVERVGTVGAINYHGQIVKWASGTNFRVVRGTHTQASALPSENVPIGEAVNLTWATVMTAGCMGSHTSGSFPGDTGLTQPDAMCTWRFADVDPSENLTLEHNNAGGATGQKISWEVVVWDTSAAAGGSGRVLWR